MAVGKPLQLRLFLEGEEVPIIAAQVSIGMNAPAAASLQVVPLDEAMDLKPRTMVHVFFLDSFDVRSSAADANSATQSEADRLNIPFLSNYKLLFSGEIVGFQFVKAPNSRAVVYQCLDFSSYWDQAHATAIEYGPNGNAFTHQGSLRASNTGLFDDIVNTTSDQLVNWLRQKPLSEGLKNISGLAGGVIHMLEQIGGVPGHTRGVNDFFTVAELRCRILAQIVAEENDNTAANLLKVSVFDEWLRNGLQNIGQQISFRDMLKLLFGYVHYDVVPNPASKFDETTAGTTIKTVITQKFSAHPQGVKALSDIAAAKVDMASIAASTDSTQLTLVARVVLQNLQRVDADLSTLQGSKKSLKSDVAKARNELAKAINALSATQRLETNTVDLNNKFVPRVITALTATEDSINGAKAVTGPGASVTNGGSQRLRAQIIRPDCFFAPPPRCNVIFPEQYTQLSYDRNYLSEVTRSLVLSYNTLVGKEALLADRYLAPSVGVDTSKIAVSPGKDGYRALMKHELHTGIIPRSEWLPNISSFSAKGGGATNGKDDRSSWATKIALFHFFKYRFGPRQASVGGRFNPYLVCGFPALVILQPFIVPGTSQGDHSTDAKVINFLLNQSQSGDPDTKPVAPRQLIGMVASLSHSIDQSGGSTSVSMNHVRQHLGVDDEFLGVFLKTKGSTKKRIRVVLTSDEISQSSKQSLKNLLIGLTPQSAAVAKSTVSKKAITSKTVQSQKTTINHVTKSKVTSPTTTSVSVLGEGTATAPPSAPALTQTGKIDGIDADVLVPSPPGKFKKGDKGVFGLIIGVEVKDPQVVKLGASQVYKSVILYEEITVPTQSTIPIEEIIRPKWFSPAYTNADIGKKIYQPFFGVPSIIDEAAFDGLGATATAEPNTTDGDPIDVAEDKDKVIARLSSEEDARAKVSIERSVNYISYIYGLVKAKGLDVDDFIKQYANRPIATLPQMLGDPDLNLTVDASGKTQVAKRADNTTPQIGFHSIATYAGLVDSKTKMAGLLDEPTLHIQRINNTGKAGPIPPDYDVRKEKKDRVRLYIAALGQGPGFRG